MHNSSDGLSSNRTVHEHFIISLTFLGPQDSCTDHLYSCSNVLCRHVCVIILIGHDRLLSLCLRPCMNLRTATCATYTTGLSLSHDTVTVLDAVFILLGSIAMRRMRQFLAVLRSFFLSPPLCTFSRHPSPPAVLPSSLTSSYHLFLGLPLNLVVPKFIYNTPLGILFPSILCTCPNQRNLFNIVNPMCG